MHERYFFMADVLTLALTAIRPSEWRAAACAQLGSCLAMLSYFTDNPVFASAGAIAMLAATVLIGRSYFPSVRRTSDERMATSYTKL